MKNGHRPGIDAGSLLARHLKLDGVGEANGRTIVEAIDQIHGVDSVLFRSAKSMLDVVYDGSQIGIDDIERVLIDCGGVIADGWWMRRKLAWYRFTDENTRSNATYVPQCCNEAPK